MRDDNKIDSLVFASGGVPFQKKLGSASCNGMAGIIEHSHSVRGQHLYTVTAYDVLGNARADSQIVTIDTVLFSGTMPATRVKEVTMGF